MSSCLSLHHSSTHPDGYSDGLQQLHSKLMQLLLNDSYLISILRQDGRELGSIFRLVVDPLVYGESFPWISLPPLHAVTIVDLAPPFPTASANQQWKSCYREAPPLTNNFEPSCSILHSGKARTEFGLLRRQIEQRTLSPIVFSSLTFWSLDSLQCSQGQRCRLCAVEVFRGF
jgi:hypothetical protein